MEHRFGRIQKLGSAPRGAKSGSVDRSSICGMVYDYLFVQQAPCVDRDVKPDFLVVLILVFSVKPLPVSMCVVSFAVSMVNEATADWDETRLATALQLPYLHLASVAGSNASTYLKYLSQALQSKVVCTITSVAYCRSVFSATTKE